MAGKGSVRVLETVLAKHVVLSLVHYILKTGRFAASCLWKDVWHLWPSHLWSLQCGNIEVFNPVWRCANTLFLKHLDCFSSCLGGTKWEQGRNERMNLVQFIMSGLLWLKWKPFAVRKRGTFFVEVVGKMCLTTNRDGNCRWMGRVTKYLSHSE